MGKYAETEEKEHALISAEMVKPWLKRLELSSPQKENIIHCIEVRSLQMKNKIKTKEAQVLQDADKLDRINSIRIANYFYNKGQKGNSLREAADYTVEAIETTRFNTATGKKLGERKMKLARRFMKEFNAERIE